MKARLYVERQLLATIDLEYVMTDDGKRKLTVNDTVTVVITDDPVTPGSRPLFAESRLESA